MLNPKGGEASFSAKTNAVKDPSLSLRMTKKCAQEDEKRRTQEGEKQSAQEGEKQSAQEGEKRGCCKCCNSPA